VAATVRLDVEGQPVRDRAVLCLAEAIELLCDASEKTDASVDIAT
jgi:hypothetical protein